MFIVGAIVIMLVLHFTGKLPPAFYNFNGVLKRSKEDTSFDLYLGEDAKSDIDKRLDIKIKKHKNVYKTFATTNPLILFLRTFF